MTAPHARQPEVLTRPAWTPTAIRAVLAATPMATSSSGTTRIWMRRSNRPVRKVT